MLDSAGEVYEEWEVMRYEGRPWNHGNLDSANKNSSQALIIPLKPPNCVLKAVLDLSLAMPSFHTYDACPRV